jgi:hypothetical protein
MAEGSNAATPLLTQTINTGEIVIYLREIHEGENN